jgi:phosphoribosylanthranilate isomerase
MTTRIKICGIATRDEAAHAIAADAIGFNGARPPGRRTIADRAIAGIASGLPASIATYPIFTACRSFMSKSRKPAG